MRVENYLKIIYLAACNFYFFGCGLVTIGLFRPYVNLWLWENPLSQIVYEYCFIPNISWTTICTTIVKFVRGTKMLPELTSLSPASMSLKLIRVKRRKDALCPSKLPSGSTCEPRLSHFNEDQRKSLQLQRRYVEKSS